MGVAVRANPLNITVRKKPLAVYTIGLVDDF
jgi:hypothetical protein